MPNMASADSAEEFVNVPRGKYQKAVSTMLQQRELIKQQELKLKASHNLFVLLQTKDNDLRRSKETEASLRVALRRTEAMLQKTLAENFFAKSKVPTSTGTKSRLEADSAPLGECDDIEADGAAPAQPFKDRLSDYSKPFNEPSPHSPVCTSQTQSSVLPSITVGGSSRSRNPVSKDLVDKLMQQNARLKKSIREILLHKGLTVSDYLVSIALICFWSLLLLNQLSSFAPLASLKHLLVWYLASGRQPTRNLMYTWLVLLSS
jgi:hypothetical protein